jgi:hypothetical protein
MKKIGTDIIGMDLGDRFSHLTALDASGEVLYRRRLATTQSALQRFFATISAVRVVIEVGTHWPWLSRLLKTLGHSVKSGGCSG